MPASKTLKKICMEAFQLAAFSTPIFVTGQRLATKECSNGTVKCPPTTADATSYWLFISAIISYVAGITLLVWIPIKLLITWKKIYRPYEGLWFPGNAIYLIFAYIPCVAAVLVGHEVCNQQSYCFDFFRGAPIETMVIMMVVTDWSEKLRYIKLRSTDDSVRTKKYPYADWNGTNRLRGLGHSTSSADDVIGTASRRSSVSQRSLLYSNKRHGTFRQKVARQLKWTDARPENLLRDLMLAYDTRLILGLSLLNGDDSSLIFQTAWIYPIYILSALSLLPLIFSPNSEIRSSMTVLFQDIPFFILRLAIFCSFGSELVLQTSMLFLLKNFFAALTFFYFNMILPWRNMKLKTQEYELNDIERDKSVTDSVGNHRVAKSSVAVGVYGEMRTGHVVGGIANPGYHSRRYNDEEPPDRQYPTRVVEDPGYDDREFFDDQPDYDDDELYPTHRRMDRPEHHVVRLERTVSEEYPTFHPQPETSVVISRHDQNRESRQSLPPRRETSTKSKIINYDTLHDPNSFLYSGDNKQERRSVKPKIVNIDFGNSPGHGNSSDAQKPGQPIPSPLNEDPPSTKPQSPSEDITKSWTEDSSRNKSHTTQPNQSTSSAQEPTYAVIRKDTKRRAAPPPPISPKPQLPLNNKALPPPPQHLLDGNQNDDATSAEKYKVVTRQESLYTASLARQLADEATGKKSRKEARKEEKEVLDALEEAVQHGKKMFNSQSTTPKSTISAPISNGVVVNDEEYDDRL